MRKILMALLFTLPLIATADMHDIKFRRLDTRDGLSNQQVNCVIRDGKGFVWIATPYGLNRYDGFRVKTYYAHASDSLTMLSNQVDEVMEGIGGRLWLRHGTGYSVFDPETGTFDRHPERWLAKEGVTGSLERVYIDRRKNLWVKTYDNGLWFLNPLTHKVRHFTWEPDVRVSDMSEQGKSLLIITNQGELICYNTEQARLSWRSHTLTRMNLTPQTDYYLFLDEQTNIWVMAGGQVYAYLRKCRRWMTSVDDALHALGIAQVPRGMKVWDMNTDSHGRLWMATDHHGLCIIDGRELRQFTTVKNDETTISDNTLRRIYRDQLGRMWISTYMMGVNYYAENLFQIRHVAAGNVNTVCTDHEGRYWLGTNDQGIICVDTLDAETSPSHIRRYTKANAGLGSDVIVSSMAATDGTLWFGTYEGGLAHYRDGRFETWKATEDGLANNNVWALCEDQWGNVWVGTLGGGLQRIDRRTGKFRTFDMGNSALASNYICSLQLTDDGLLLVGHTEFYSLADPKSLTIRNCRIEDARSDIPLTPSSNQVIQDSRGLVWQAAASGVTISDRKTGTNYFLDGKMGLIGSVVNGLVEDNDKTMWVVTQNGLSRVVLTQQDGRWTMMVHSFSNRDGLQDASYNQRSVVVTTDGHIVIGGHEGIDIVNPANMSRKQDREAPLISSVKVEDRRLSVQLASTSGEVHNQARFAYQLAGYDRQWRYTQESRPDIVYNDLPMGDYQLLVRMLNDDGSLGHDEVALAVSIPRPWYCSWWMLLGGLVAVIGTGCYLYHYQLTKKREAVQEQELQQTVRPKLKPQIREVEVTSLDEKLVRDATDYVEKNLSNSDISVETMAMALGMSRVHLYKRLTALTDLTPSEFIRQIRLQHAEQLLLKSQLTVAEVAYSVGFNNPRAFSKYFKEMYGKIPSEYKNRQE